MREDGLGAVTPRIYDQSGIGSWLAVHGNFRSWKMLFDVVMMRVIHVDSRFLEGPVITPKMHLFAQSKDIPVHQRQLRSSTTDSTGISLA